MNILSELKSNRDARGALFPFDFHNLTFVPKRMFYVKDVPINDVRGQHAHKATDQVLFCLSGGIKIDLFDGKETQSFILKEGMYVFEKRMTWTTLTFLEKNTTLLALSSEEYDPNDYIRDYQTYLNSI